MVGRMAPAMHAQTVHAKNVQHVAELLTLLAAYEASRSAASKQYYYKSTVGL